MKTTLNNCLTIENIQVTTFSDSFSCLQKKQSKNNHVIHFHSSVELQYPC